MNKPTKWSEEEWRLFQVFNTSNKDLPHYPLDYKKWNAFVIEAHKTGSKLLRDDVHSAMKKAGWPDDGADDFADRFDEYKDLLSMYDAT